MRPRPSYLFCLVFCFLFSACSSSPLNSNDNVTVSSSDKDGVGANFMISWLWGIMWGDDSAVTVVDRTPVLTFDARPAAFGPIADVLGYLIRVEDFSEPCGDDDDGGESGIDRPTPGGWLPGGGEYEYEDEEAAWVREAREGCPKLCVQGPHEPRASETWIALVMRGGCPFVDKVRQAQSFGAKGVVVGGANFDQDRHGDGLVQMYSVGDASNVTIPSTYITHTSYLTLSSLIASSNTSTWGLRTVSVGIISDPSGWEWYSPLLTFLILLFLPSSLTLITLLIHRIRAARAAQRERAPEDIVQNLPWRVWEGPETLWELEKTLESTSQVAQSVSSETLQNIEESSSEIPAPSTSNPREIVEAEALAASEDARKWYETQVECAICLEEFVKGDKVRVLPCRHIFHMEEVDDWLIHRKKLCPICKHDVTRPISRPSRRGSIRSLPSDPSTPAPLSTSEQRSLDRTISADSNPTERTPLLP